MAASDVLFANNITLTLASPLGSGDATMTVSSSVGVPTITPPEFYYASIEDYSTGATEIVMVTARTGPTWTITRAQDGTLAQAFATATTIVQLRPVAQHLRDLWDAVLAGGGGGDTVPSYLEDGTAPAALGTPYQLFRVNAAATAFEFSYGLPASLGSGGQQLRVNAGGTALEYATGLPLAFGSPGQVIRVNTGGTALEYGYGLPLTIGTAKQMLQVNAGGTALEFIARPLDIHLGFGGTYLASQELARVTISRSMTLPASLTGSVGSCAVAPTVSSVVLDLKKNGTGFGTVTFAVSATTCTFVAASSTSFVSGDVLTLVAPAGTNATFSDCGITLQGSHS